MSDPATSVLSMDTTTLTDRERDMLSLERLWWQYAGAKETAIRQKFDVTTTSYYQELNALIEREEALAFDPLVVKRLRRLRDSRKVGGRSVQTSTG